MKFDSLNHNVRILFPNQTEGFYNLRENLGAYFLQIAEKYLLIPEKIKLIDGGINSVLIKFKNKHSSYLLKITANKDATSEIFFYRALSANNLPVPKIINFNLTEGLIPYQFFIMEEVEGVQSFQGHTNDKTAISGGYLYAKELKKVHNIAVNGFGKPLDIEGENWSQKSWLGALKSFFDENAGYQNVKNLFTSEQLKAIYRLTILNQKLEILKPCLLHGDIPNSLMQIKPTIKFLAFIDPSGIIGGDYLYDVSSVYHINEKGEIGVGFMKGFEKGCAETHPMNDQEIYRFHCLRLFHLFWKSGFFYKHGWSTSLLHEQTLAKLKQIQQQYDSL